MADYILLNLTVKDDRLLNMVFLINKNLHDLFALRNRCFCPRVRAMVYNHCWSYRMEKGLFVTRYIKERHAYCGFMRKYLMTSSLRLSRDNINMPSNPVPGKSYKSRYVDINSSK